MSSKGEFWALPKDIMQMRHISLEARVLYAFLWTRKNGENVAWPGQKYLAEQLGVGERSIRRYLDELKKEGLIEVEQQGLKKTNRYFLTGQNGHSRTATPVRSRPAIAVSDPIVREQKEENRSISDAPPAAAIFNIKDEIEKMKSDKRRDINLIGEFIEEKKIPIHSRAELNVIIRRHLRAANQLKAFPDSRIGWATRKAQNEWPDYTLETLVKYLSKA